MNWSWLAFIVGVLVGWLLEWLIDFLFWRRKHRAQETELVELRQQLDRAQGQQHDWEAQAAQCAQDLEACRADLEASRADLAAYREGVATDAFGTRAAEAPVPLDLDAEEAGAEAAADQVDPAEFSSVQAAQAQVEVSEALAGEAPQGREGAGPADDVPEIPQMEQEAPEVEEAVATRAGAGMVFPLAEAEAPAPVPDDLKKIEGVGPKIAGLLKEAGLASFAQVAAAPVERLQEILTAAGSRYRMADPTTWPEQARLAAEAKWDELQSLQDRLSGGRKAEPSEDE